MLRHYVKFALCFATLWNPLRHFVDPCPPLYGTLSAARQRLRRWRALNSKAVESLVTEAYHKEVLNKASKIMAYGPKP